MIEILSFGFKIFDELYWWPWIYWRLCQGNTPGAHCWNWTLRETAHTLTVIAPLVAAILIVAFGAWWIAGRSSSSA